MLNLNRAQYHNYPWHTIRKLFSEYFTAELTTKKSTFSNNFVAYVAYLKLLENVCAKHLTKFKFDYLTRNLSVFSSCF